MKLIRWIPLALVSISFIAGCSGAEPEAGQAAERATSAGYGYEMLPEHLGPGASAAATPPAAPAAVSGRLAPETVRDVVRAGSGALSACHQSGIAGEIAVRFSIGEDGRVSGAKVERTAIPEGAVSTCVVAAFGALRFPTSTAGTATVIYPVRFDP